MSQLIICDFSAHLRPCAALAHGAVPANDSRLSHVAIKASMHKRIANTCFTYRYELRFCRQSHFIGKFLQRNDYTKSTRSRKFSSTAHTFLVNLQDNNLATGICLGVIRVTGDGKAFSHKLMSLHER